MAYRKYFNKTMEPVFIDEHIEISQKEQDLVRVIDNTMDSLLENKTEKELANIQETPEIIEGEKTDIETKNDSEDIETIEIEEKKDIEIADSSKTLTEDIIPKKPILKKVEEKVTEVTGWNKEETVKLGVFSFKNKSERTVFFAFIVPPLVISFISMIHVVSFFELSNTIWLSWALASAFEFASIAALFALTALTKIKRNTVWILFFVIVLMQVVGNMYHSYIHMDPLDPNLLKLLSILGIDALALPWTLRILGFLQGGILPCLALTFVKCIVEYLAVNRKEEN